MRRRILLLVPFFLFLAFVPFNFERLFLKVVHADDTTITGSVEWSGEKLITNKITVPMGATLTIKKGAKVSFATGAGMLVTGTLTVEGTVREPVTFRGKDGAQTGYVIGISGGTATIRGADVSGGGGRYTSFASADLSLRAEAMIIVPQLRYGTFYCSSSCHLNVESTVFHNNAVAFSVLPFSPSSYDVTIRESAFQDNTYDVDNLTGVGFYSSDWWGSSTGPDHAKVSSFTNTDSWLDHNPICTDACHSNVLFLPGIKASRLYMKDAKGNEDQLWQPSYFDDDPNKLALDSDGKSVNKVYTRDVLDRATVFNRGDNIYKSFIDRLSSLKTDGTINDYNLFAYDWRQNVEDVVKSGTPYPNSVVQSVVAETIALAESSKSGQVTIVAHSNGGLVAKALMLELAKENKTFLVDTIAMVDVPQMGAPISLLSLLYGYDESILGGTLVSQKDARSLAENMPGAYGLLPSDAYFGRMQSPFVTFSATRSRYKAYRDVYGGGIDSADELEQFLTAAKDKRAKPDASDVESENVLRKNLLDEAMATHNRLDNWTPQTDVNVIEVAGWGLDTVSGVDYIDKEATRCSLDISGHITCAGTGEYESVYDPKFTVDGDEVVTAPSALMLPEEANVKRYWVDLYAYDSFIRKGYSHKDILEVPSTEQFLSNIITENTTAPLPDYIQTSRPADYQNAKPRLRMSLYSPLTINLYDDQGNHTGPKDVTEDGVTHTIIEENIPNSYYYQFGERKYVGWSEETPISVKMDGYADGSYTLKLDEVKPTATGEETIAHTAFANLPVTTETTVSLDVPTTGIANLSALQADLNGDQPGGTYTVTPVLNGTATLVNDTVAPQTTAALSGKLGRSGWYMSDVKVTLSAKDNDGGSGVNKTEYSLDGGSTWQTYGGPVTVSQEGALALQYTSTDKQGNREDTKTVSMKIDKTAPEVRVIFNLQTKKLDIRGVEPSSYPVSIMVTAPWGFSPALSPQNRSGSGIRTIATLSEASGHSTNLVLEKTTDTVSTLALSLSSVVYDGVITTFPKADLSYSWSLDSRTGKYASLTSRAETSDVLLYALYDPNANTTQMIRMPKEQGRIVGQTTESVTGMVVPYLETVKGKVNVGY